MSYQTSYQQMQSVVESAVASYSKFQTTAESFLASYRGMESQLSTTARWCKDYEQSERARQISFYEQAAKSTALVRGITAQSVTSNNFLGSQTIQAIARMKQQELNFAARSASIIDTSQMESMRQVARMERYYNFYASQSPRNKATDPITIVHQSLHT